MADTTMANVPYQAPVVDQRGMLTPAWNGFFRNLYQRIGQQIAPSNTDISTLQTTTTSHATSLDTLEGAITKGRQL